MLRRLTANQRDALRVVSGWHPTGFQPDDGNHLRTFRSLRRRGLIEQCPECRSYWRLTAAGEDWSWKDKEAIQDAA